MKKITANILIVDDNEEVLIALGILLKRYFTGVSEVATPHRIPELIRNENIDVIILDMNFSAKVTTGNEGLYWMQEIKKLDPGISVIFLTAYGDIELAVRTIREGAIDFIQKPWDNDKVITTIRNAVDIRRKKQEIGRLKEKQKHLAGLESHQYDFFTGESRLMQQVLEKMKKIANTTATVLVLGENGTGKELIAREIHRMSDRSNEVFVSVDLGSIPETLFESELFGHVKGAFTSANNDRAGRFELASGGTLFLDEIGNLELPMQAKLLSALQNQVIYRVGSPKPIPIDVRVICATNQPIPEMVQEKAFREDLYYRINTIQIHVPPLRKRGEDIPLLLRFFLDKWRRKYNKAEFKIYPAVYDYLLKYRWPGNIREFEHVIERAVILADSDTLTAEDFELNLEYTADHLTTGHYDLEENEKLLIIKAIKEFNGNLTTIAGKLGVTRATLYRKIDKYQIKV